jgi:neutral ceramidase
MKRLLVPSLILFLAQTAAAAGLRAGAGAVKITPPRGAPLAGYYYNRAADGIRDDLWAKALVLEEGTKRAALVACDIINLPRPVVEEARRLMARDSGIPADAVMIGATHTHTGPVLLTPGSRYNLEGEMLRIAQKYTDELPGMIAESVRLACAGLREARPAAGRGREDALAFNRRFHMKDGSVGWNPGKLNPRIVRPAGPIDPEVPVVFFETPDADPVAVYVNYAMHQDTVGGTEYSADYAGVLSRLLKDVRGSGLTTLFTIGCAGNVNHFDVGRADPQRSPGEAARIGTILAAEVLKVLNDLESIPDRPLRARSVNVPLALPRVTAEDVAWASKITPTFGRPDAAPFMDLVRAFKIAEVAARERKPLEAEVQVIALGKDVAWVGLPGEIFTELGLAIKAASPFRYTLIAELTNDSLGYIPNLKAYDEGAYEVESARCGPGSGEKLVEAAVRLLVDLHREK